MKPIIGLTGGIGSGKSTVAQLFAKHGVAVVDADAIARQTSSAGGSAVAALHQTFGDELVDPTLGLKRDSMRERAFVQPLLRQELEQVLRPYIVAGILSAVQQALHDPNSKAVLLDIPLLVENLAVWREHIHHLVVVDCAVETQIRRVLSRPTSAHWSRQQVEQAIAIQATRAQRKRAADFIINNDDGVSPHQLAVQVLRIWQRITDGQSV